MSSSPISLREVKSRIECGVAGIKEAAYLVDLIELITYPSKGANGLCRICGMPRYMGHANYCAAAEVV